MAQGIKVNPCKFETTKDDITSFVMPNNKHLAPFVDLILTLIWAPLDESVFYFFVLCHCHWLAVRECITTRPSLTLRLQMGSLELSHRQTGRKCFIAIQRVLDPRLPGLPQWVQGAR